MREAVPLSRVARGREPAWLLLLIGLLAGDAFGRRGATAGAVRAADVAGEDSSDLSRWSPRALRRLPGIGETRAIEVAQARWRHATRGGPLYLADLPGIGPLTEARIQEWLTSGSPTTNQDPSKPPSYQGPGSGGVPGDLHSLGTRRAQLEPHSRDPAIVAAPDGCSGPASAASRRPGSVAAVGDRRGGDPGAAGGHRGWRLAPDAGGGR